MKTTWRQLTVHSEWIELKTKQNKQNMKMRQKMWMLNYLLDKLFVVRMQQKNIMKNAFIEWIHSKKFHKEIAAIEANETAAFHSKHLLHGINTLLIIVCLFTVERLNDIGASVYNISSWSQEHELLPWVGAVLFAQNFIADN